MHHGAGDGGNRFQMCRGGQAKVLKAHDLPSAVLLHGQRVSQAAHPGHLAGVDGKSLLREQLQELSANGCLSGIHAGPHDQDHGNLESRFLDQGEGVVLQIGRTAVPGDGADVLQLGRPSQIAMKSRTFSNDTPSIEQVKFHARLELRGRIAGKSMQSFAAS